MPDDRNDRQLLEIIPHMVWMTDANGLTTYVNDQSAITLGVTAAEIVGTGWKDLVHPDDLPVVGELWAAAVRGGTGFSGKYRMRHADGTYRWHLGSGVPVRRADGTIDGWVGTMTDIDDLMRTQAALAESEQRFRQITEAIHEVFWLTTPQKDRLVYVSPGYERIWGRSRESLYASARSWLDAIHPDDRRRISDAFAADHVDGGYDVEYRVVRPDGTIRWVRDRSFVVHDERGQFVRIAGVAQDITERKNLEAQLRQAQRLEAVGQLAGGIAHDFNNLLTIITGYSEMLAAGLPDDGSRDVALEIKKAGERAAELTGQLLSFSRRQMLAPVIVDVNDIVRGTEKMLRRVVGEDVELRVAVSEAPQRVKVDPGQLEQALLNLVVNARDAMPRGGVLTVRTEPLEVQPGGSSIARPGRYVVLTVKDTGVGMTDDVRRRIFEPFFTTKDVGKGTGLGLSVVHGFVTQTGGHLDVESQPGAGTAFHVYLPAVAQTDEAPASPAAPDVGHAPRGTETVLLVEDEDSLRRLTSRILERHGYRVIAADGADAALRLAEDEAEIDLLVTDVVMPGMGGRALADTLGSRRPGLKVLFVSGYTDDTVVRNGILHDRVAFLQKPFTPAALVGKVRDVLDAK